MSDYLVPMLAAFACAICNGLTAVLQKISADKEKNVDSLDARLLIKLMRDKPYVIGVILDGVGWLFTLYAVRYLPLFLVQAIIASSIAITAVIERMFRHQFIERRSYLAISIILVGLLLLALSSTPERAHSISHTLRWLIIISPLPIAAVGVFLARAKNHKSTIGLAALSGIAFGSTSIIGRIFSFSKPAWHTVYSPLVIAIIASGILGILLFSTALQRLNATAVNATMTASQTLVPAVVGIVFLGDHPRNGLWDVVVLGGLLTLGGVLVLSIKGHQEKPEKTRV